MREARLRGYLGLSLRAGQAVFGEAGVRKAAEEGKLALILLEKSASANTRKRYESLSERCGISLIPVEDGTLESATGKPGVAMGVRNGSLAEQIISCLNRAEDDTTGK